MKRQAQPKTRSHIAQAAWFRNSAGKMGGSTKQQNRRDRRQTKQELRNA
jgi:hypothetical protein